MNLSDNMHLIDEMMPFVVSNDRAKDMVAKIKHAFTKKVTTATAISYGALQDYRAITGENRTTIVFNI